MGETFSPTTASSNGKVVTSKMEKNGKLIQEENVEDAKLPKQKSVLMTYVLWLFGGLFGLHHLYLRRDRHAFVWWCTLGGYFGIGWIAEIYQIPELVRDANEDPKFIAKFSEKLRTHRNPEFSTTRFLGAIMVGYFWGQLAMIAIPEDVFAGIDWSFLHWIIPFACALGVWTVGNIGREKGVFWHCLIASYISYLSRYFVLNEAYWFTTMAFCSALIFDTFSKQWRYTKPKSGSVVRRTATISGAVVIYLSLWGCYFYFNGRITDIDGDEVPVHEAIRNLLKSPWWTDLKETFHGTIQFAQHNGWYETWKMVVETLDADGEQNAYKVLNVSPTASQTEITSVWRKLSRENHPDKVKDESKRREANERFMEIQQAYEVLSKIKNKRRQRNKKFDEEL